MTEGLSPAVTTDPAVIALAGSTETDNSVGYCLRIAREARGETLADVAQALRIGVRQVEAIEQDQWAALPGVPFVRGFVRNYARWVGLDGDKLVARIEVNDLPGTPVLDVRASTTAVLPHGNDGPRRDSAILGLALVAVVGAVALYFFVPDDFWTLPGPMHREPAPTGAVMQAPPVATTTVPTLVEPVALAAAGAVPVAAAAPPLPAAGSASVGVVPAETAALAVPAPAVTPVPALEAAAAVVQTAPVALPPLELRFDARAWAEVRDSQGMPIFSETVDAGETRTVAGKGPFLVVVGRADAVRLRYKGKTVNLEPHSRRNVARLTLE